MITWHLLAGAAVLLAAGYRADFEHYAVSTIGLGYRVRRRSVREPGHECADCGTTITIGEHREWFREWVVFGVVVWRSPDGERRYCADHAAFEVRGDLRPVRSFDDHRIPAAVGAGAARATHRLPGTGAETDDSPFENVMQTVGATASLFDLLGVALLILPLVAILYLTGGLAGGDGE